ncbi:MAG: CBS domain-containing protein, partial [Calothrix sp. SM1_5_4]|nr:CBS domain-containing protein [Calothrix sp. SM1_5_4]
MNSKDDLKPNSVSITEGVSLDDAREVMRSWGVRHLPVVEGMRVVGVI